MVRVVTAMSLILADLAITDADYNVGQRKSEGQARQRYGAKSIVFLIGGRDNKAMNTFSDILMIIPPVPTPQPPVPPSPPTPGPDVPQPPLPGPDIPRPEPQPPAPGPDNPTPEPPPPVTPPHEPPLPGPVNPPLPQPETPPIKVPGTGLRSKEG